MERVLHGETQGGQAGRARRTEVHLADTRGYSHATTRRDFQPVAQTKTNRCEANTVGCLLRCVHTLQVKLWAAHANKSCFGVQRFKFDTDERDTSRGSAECNFFFETRSSDLIHHVHTHTQSDVSP